MFCRPKFRLPSNTAMNFYSSYVFTRYYSFTTTELKLLWALLHKYGTMICVRDQQGAGQQVWRGSRNMHFRFPLINISVAGSQDPTSHKITIHEILLLIPHKQNPQTEINQLVVTTKISLHSGIVLCVASVAVQSWQADFHVLQ